MRWNGYPNVTVHPYALSDCDGESRFGGTGTSKMFALGAGEEIVRVHKAATLVALGTCPPPTFMKIDVEGAEGDTLAGALSALPRSARLLIALHGPEADERCRSLLHDVGFELHASRALERSRRGPWQSDPDLFCLGPDADARDDDIAVLRKAGF